MSDPQITGIPSKSDPFFVGYFKKIPTIWRRKVHIIVLFTLVLAALLAFMTSSQQAIQNDGKWEAYDDLIEEGVLLLSPYPMILSEKSEKNPFGMTLLTEYGKLGLFNLGRLEGRHISVKGSLVEYGPWRMVEATLEDIEEKNSLADVRSMNMEATINPQLTSIQLEGEILDSKCSLGVMKPGEGTVHRACAQICLIGGIPPLFKMVSQSGATEIYLLTDLDGKPLAPEVVAEFAGIAVRLEGNWGHFGDMPLLGVDPSSIAFVK